MKLGIDLGTSNSSIAFLDRITEELINIKISTGNEPYDSVLRSCALLGDKVLIGSIAESEYTKSPSQSKFIDSFKPYLNENQLRNSIMVSGRPVIVGYDYHLQQPIWSDTERRLYIGSEFSKNEIMLGIKSFLSYVLNNSQSVLIDKGEDCDGYLLGIPLNAKSYYRFRLLEAIKESSPYSESFRSVLQKTTFIPEPVAVSFCFHEQISEKDKTILIFDYGGGTLDLALLKFEKIDKQILPTSLLGLSTLDKAGKYIDDILKKYLMEKYNGYEKRYNQLDSARKYFEDQQIESLKIKLSVQKKVKETLISGAIVDINRNEFKDILSRLFTDIDQCIEQSLIDGKIDDYEQIDKVIMSGGSSLIPAVQEHLADIFGDKKVICLDPNKSESVEIALTGVSRGLAKYDHFIEMSGLQVNEYKLWDQNTGNFITVLKRNHKKGKAYYDPQLEGYRSATFAIFYDMIKEEPLIRLDSLPFKSGEKLKIQFIQKNIYGAFPEILITNSNGIVSFKKDLSKLSESDAEQMIKNCDWGYTIGTGVSWEMLPVPLEAGNFIKIKNNNTIYKIKEESEQIVQCMFFKQCIQLGGIENCDGQFCNKGSITFRKTGIRNIDSGQFVKATNHWDLSKFAFELIDENSKAESHKSLKSYEVKIYQ